MEKKYILLISYFYAPSGTSGSIRFSYLSKLLEDKSFEVHVVAIKEKYISDKDSEMPSAKFIHRTSIIPSFSYTSKNVISRKFNRFIFKYSPIDPYLGWVIPGTLKAISVIRKNKFDKIIVTGPPFSQFLIGYFASLFTKAELYIDYQDPWFLWDSYSSFFRARISLKKITLFIERTILGRAKKIVLNTSVAMDEYVKKFPHISDKFTFITNAYPELKEQSGISLEDDKIVILYAGIFYGERRLSYLLEALEELIRNNEVGKDEIRIHVFGEILLEDNELIKKLNLQTIVIAHERISYQKVLQYMKGADILYLTQGYDHRHCIPYKLIDYLSVKKPIFSITSKDSATYKVMKEINCGEVAEMTNPEAVYNSLKKIINKKDYTFNGIEKYSWASVTEDFIKLLDE